MFLRAASIVALTLAAACGGAPPRASSAPPETTVQADPALDAISAQLSTLRHWYDQIDDGPWERPIPPRALCSIDEPTECPELCGPADHVCDAAAAVCDLADELDGHPWADRKCVEARGKCGDSRAACCSCGQRASGLIL